MSLKTSIVGVQVKHIKGALQYLAKIGEGTCHALFTPVAVPAPWHDLKGETLPAGSEVLIEALPEKVSTLTAEFAVTC